jgi:hypothetical protein
MRTQVGRAGGATALGRAIGALLLVVAGAVALAPPAHAAGPILTVTHTADDQQPGSLRAVIDDANAHPAADATIQLPAGRYTLDRCGSTVDDADNAWGDLDLGTYAGIARIVALGSGATVEQTCADERVLDVHSYGQFTIDNLTITGGQGRERGGGLNAIETVVIVRSHFLDNVARGKPGTAPTPAEPYAANGGSAYGGAVAAGLVAVATSTFEGNRAIGGTGWAQGGGGGSATGGAIATGGFSASTTVFRDNAALGTPRTSTGGGGSALGGAVNANKVTATNVTFDHNEANASDGTGETAQGGAVHAGSDVTFTDVTATDNHAIGDANRSGDFVNSGGVVSGETSVVITRGVLSGNTAAARGGAVFSYSVTLDRAYLHDNGAGREGGAVMARNQASVTDSTLDANRAPSGGGLATASFGSVVVRNSTIVGNVASAANGTLKPGAAFFTKLLQLEATTMVANVGTTAVDGPSLQVRQSVLGQQSGGSLCAATTTAGSGGSNVADDTSCVLQDPSDRQGPRPLYLGALRDNGGPTPTRAPLSGSPLADAVPVAACSTATDQRGVARPQGPLCDIGAVETANGTAPPADVGVALSGPPAAAKGEAVTYIATVTSTGGASTPYLTVDVPSGGPPAFGVTAVDAPSGATCARTGGHITCTWESPLAAGAHADVVVHATLQSTIGTTTVTAAVEGPGADPSTGNNNSTTSTARSTSHGFFHPMAPVRILDSRSSTGGWNAPLTAGTPRALVVAGPATGIPTHVDAVVLNVTVTDATDNSFITVHPAGSPTPVASNLNFAAGETTANAVTVKVGTDDQIMFANAVGSAHVVVDVVGSYSAADGDRFTAVTPTRLLDSRTGTGFAGPVVAGAPRSLQVAAASGPVPASASAVVLNVTVTEGTANSFLTVHPGGGPAPNASTLNFGPGQTKANVATVALSPAGTITFANEAGAVAVVADVVGYFDPTQGDVFHAVDPVRLLDSRGPVGGWGGPLVAGTSRQLPMTSPVAPAATAVVGNVTVTGSTAASYLTVEPAGVAPTDTSTLNFATGQTIPNVAVTKVGAGSALTFRTRTGSTHVVYDVVGYYTPG